MVKWRHLVISEETYNLIMIDCTEEFKRHHPHMHGARITHNMIANWIAKYYLKS